MKALNHLMHCNVMKLGSLAGTRYVSKDPYLNDEIFSNWLGCFSHNSAVWIWVWPGPSVSWCPFIRSLWLHILSIVRPISRLTRPPLDILINCLSLVGWQQYWTYLLTSHSTTVSTVYPHHHLDWTPTVSKSVIFPQILDFPTSRFSLNVPLKSLLG